jgi:hypothetical protein
MKERERMGTTQVAAQGRIRMPIAVSMFLGTSLILMLTSGLVSFLVRIFYFAHASKDPTIFLP